MKSEYLYYGVIAIVVVFGLYYIVFNRGAIQNEGELTMNDTEIINQEPNIPGINSETLPSNNIPGPVGDTTENFSPDYKDLFPKAQLTSTELLPKDSESTLWAQQNPVGSGGLQGQASFLDAGNHIGINTVGQSRGKNPNFQIRSEPPNPQVLVSPWNNSTFEPDMARRYFEIGSY